MTPQKDARDHDRAGRRGDDYTLHQLLDEFRELKIETQGQTATLNNITSELATMREILTAWNNLRGTGAVLRAAGKVVIGLAAVGTAVLALLSVWKSLLR